MLLIVVDTVARAASVLLAERAENLLNKTTVEIS